MESLVPNEIFRAFFTSPPSDYLKEGKEVGLQVFDQRNHSVRYTHADVRLSLAASEYRKKDSSVGAGVVPLFFPKATHQSYHGYVFYYGSDNQLRPLGRGRKIPTDVVEESIPLLDKPIGLSLSKEDDSAKVHFFILLTKDPIDPQAITSDSESPLDTDWGVHHLSLHLLSTEPAIGKEGEISLADSSIRIKAHPALRAKVRLNKVGESDRDMEGISAFPLLMEEGIKLMDISGARSSDRREVIEFNDIEIEDPQILKEHPLEMVLSQALGEEEMLLPIAYDGESFHVVGEAESEGEETVVRIQEIPEEQKTDGNAGDRNLFRAFKLAFLKLAFRKPGLNQLRWVTYHQDGSFTYQKEGIREKVDAANRILLAVHGIIGNTKSLLKGLPHALNEEGKSLKDQFDLILAFDYENLNTPIEEIALDLKTQLQQAGIGEFDQKELSIMCVSMGGLVVRSMIEQSAGGNKLVDHVIMVGTPNAGSHLGELVSGNSFKALVLSIALNTLPSILQAVGTFLYQVKREGGVLYTLRQMAPGSDFLTQLNSMPDPGIPYSILGGDISQGKARGKGLGKLTDAILLKFGEWVNPDVPHDVAVPLANIFNEEVWKARASQVELYQTDCHHLAYFFHDPALEVLGKMKVR